MRAGGTFLPLLVPAICPGSASGRHNEHTRISGSLHRNSLALRSNADYEQPATDIDLHVYVDHFKKSYLPRKPFIHHQSM